mmetsp:Transcript_17016/g.26265  ORF Transcript_17016/g.26265 Transcript_17016/m.26265 type:complete len:107 (+) Transcript_17016:808-1128(+)
MFDIIQGMVLFDVKLTCYMIEIYKGDLRDLLLPKNVKEKPKLEPRFREGGMVEISNVTVKSLKSMKECNDVFEHGLKGRMVRQTKMNDESSRSHLIFSIIIESTNK